MSKADVVAITRRGTFSAAHRLCSSSLTDEENEQLYGKCTNKNGHGHNYVVEVTVKGIVKEQTGMVMNLSDLKVVFNEVLVQVDHKHLDLDVPFFRGDVPPARPSTVENVARFFYVQLVDKLPAGVQLYKIKVHETENNVAVFRGETSSSSSSNLQ